MHVGAALDPVQCTPCLAELKSQLVNTLQFPESEEIRAAKIFETQLLKAVKCITVGII